MAALEITLFTQPGKAPKCIRLQRSSTTIGRAKTNLVHIDDPYISSTHAIIIKRNGY